MSKENKWGPFVNTLEFCSSTGTVQKNNYYYAFLKGSKHGPPAKSGTKKHPCFDLKQKTAFVGM